MVHRSPPRKQILICCGKVLHPEVKLLRADPNLMRSRLVQLKPPNVYLFFPWPIPLKYCDPGEGLYYVPSLLSLVDEKVTMCLSCDWQQWSNFQWLSILYPGTMPHCESFYILRTRLHIGITAALASN
jgi:hypothetical protein